MAVYVTRKEWGARAANRGGNQLVANVMGTGIHWHGGPVASRVRHHHQCAGVVRQIQSDHQNSNGWADIAYTDLVCPHGYIFEGRGRGNGTAAFGNSFHNARYYATCAIWGKGDGPANRAMLDGLADAVALHRKWGARTDVIGHRDAFATECPGDELYAYVQAGRFHTIARRDDLEPVTTQDTGDLTMSQYEDLKKRIDAIAVDVKTIKTATTHMPRRVWSYRIDTPESVKSEFGSVNPAYSAGGLLAYNLIDFYLIGGRARPHVDPE